jgi:hypothetical protein
MLFLLNYLILISSREFNEKVKENAQYSHIKIQSLQRGNI